MRPNTLREFHERYHNGEFNTKDINTQIEAGWTDWFCKDKSLPSRLEQLNKVIDGITSDHMLDNYSVLFRNCSAPNGSLFDVIKFEPVGIDAVKDREKHDQLAFDVTVDHKNKNKYVVHTGRSGYQSELGSNNIEDIHDFINSWEEAHTEDQDFGAAVADIPVDGEQLNQ